MTDREMKLVRYVAALSIAPKSDSEIQKAWNSLERDQQIDIVVEWGLMMDFTATSWNGIEAPYGAN